jgi:pimeloyl-ACP methyl ester carboxylesterase
MPSSPAETTAISRSRPRNRSPSACKGRSGSDPRPYLEQLRIPALWLYGTADREVPVDQSVALLDRLKAQGNDFTVVTFPGAGHGLLDSPPADPKAPTTFVQWVLKRVHAGAPKGS